MKKTDILIIGGGIAGTTVAETVRAKDPNISITIVSSEQRSLYSRVLLPYAVKEKMSLEKVALRQPDFYDANGIEYLSGFTVAGVDPKKKMVQLDDGENIAYEKMVIATGGYPKAWDVPGANLDGVMRLQTYEDARDITARAKSGGRMVIIGTGFISLEFTAIALHYGMQATILNRGKHFCSSLIGPEIASVLRDTLRSHGVDIVDNVLVREVVGEDEVTGVLTIGGETIDCAMVGVGIGLDLSTSGLDGIAVGLGILANKYLETSLPDVWTAGDCAEFQDVLLGIRHTAGNWTNAMAQGRHVGRALLGERKPYEMLTSYTSACVPGISLIFIGETRSHRGSDRVERVIEDGKKVVEFRIHSNRVIGAILLNAPEERATVQNLITSKKSVMWKKKKLADPNVSLAGFLK